MNTNITGTKTKHTETQAVNTGTNNPQFKANATGDEKNGGKLSTQNQQAGYIGICIKQGNSKC